MLCLRGINRLFGFNWRLLLLIDRSLLDSADQVLEHNERVFLFGHVELHVGDFLGANPLNLKNQSVLILPLASIEHLDNLELRIHDNDKYSIYINS